MRLSNGMTDYHSYQIYFINLREFFLTQFGLNMKFMEHHRGIVNRLSLTAIVIRQSLTASAI